MRSSANFKQADLTRALKAMAAARVRVSRVEIELSGKVVLFPVDGPPPPGHTCDDLLEPGFMPTPIALREHG